MRADREHLEIDDAKPKHANDLNDKGASRCVRSVTSSTDLSYADNFKSSEGARCKKSNTGVTKPGQPPPNTDVNKLEREKLCNIEARPGQVKSDTASAESTYARL